MFWHRRSSGTESSGKIARVQIERVGEERIERISKAAKSMPWQVLLLELAWTAGPATFLAAAGGYYLGYGKHLPAENAIFFLAYTVIFGIIGLITKLVHGTVWQPRKQHAQRQLSNALDMLPDLALAERELRLAAMAPEVRRLEAAGYLLQRVNLESQTLALLVEELTGDRGLGQTAGKIEMYRRAGLNASKEELTAECRDAAIEASGRIAQLAPQTASLLGDRLFGRAPMFEDGVARPENFIERILAAIEQDDDNLMTLEDAEQVLLLALELLGGRCLPILAFEYKGRWEAARAMDALNERWNRYRLAKAVGYSRLKALEELLANSSSADVSLGADGRNPADLSRNTLAGIRSVNDAAEGLLALPGAQQQQHRDELRSLAITLSAALRLQAAARRACSQLGRRHALFLHNLRAWEEAATRRQGEGPPTLRSDSGKNGLQLVERRVELNDAEKLKLAAALDAFLGEHRVNTRNQQVQFGPPGRERLFNTDLAKSLAIELLLQLEELIGLSRPEVQRAIYASPVANFHGLEPGQSAATKAGLAAAAAQELRDDLGPVAERLATVLVTQYQVELNAESIDFLCRNYGARRERLQTLTGNAAGATRRPFSSLHGAPRCNLMGDPDWDREVTRARRFLRKLG